MNNVMRAVSLLVLVFVAQCGGELASQGDDADATAIDSQNKPPVDSGPVNLFDLGVTDITIADVNLAACYKCITNKCALALATCEVDPNCESLATCALQTCPANFTDPTCLTGCGLLSSSPPTELILTALCADENCSSKCL